LRYNEEIITEIADSLRQFIALKKQRLRNRNKKEG
jgi:hypothetical protein